jgi:hypothetical protein
MLTVISLIIMAYFVVKFTDKHVNNLYEKSITCPPHNWITKKVVIEEGEETSYLVCEQCKLLGNNPDGLQEQTFKS